MELLEKKKSGSGLESREYCRRNPSRWPCGTLYPQKLARTSPTSGGLSDGIVNSRTQAKEFSFFSRAIYLATYFDLQEIILYRWRNSPFFSRTLPFKILPDLTRFSFLWTSQQWYLYEEQSSQTSLQPITWSSRSLCFMSRSNKETQLHPQVMGFLFLPFY
jgi:hypothetical protein